MEKETPVLLSGEYDQRPEWVIAGKKLAEMKTEEEIKMETEEMEFGGNRGERDKDLPVRSLFLLSQVMCFILMVEVMCQVRES